MLGDALCEHREASVASRSCRGWASLGSKDLGPWRTAGLLTSLGFLLAVSTLLGAGLGYWLDSRWGTRPWLTLVGLFLGLAAGFVEMFRILKQYLDTD